MMLVTTVAKIAYAQAILIELVKRAVGKSYGHEKWL